MFQKRALNFAGLLKVPRNFAFFCLISVSPYVPKVRAKWLFVIFFSERKKNPSALFKHRDSAVRLVPLGSAVWWVRSGCEAAATDLWRAVFFDASLALGVLPMAQVRAHGSWAMGV